jgi:hypothetical protein
MERETEAGSRQPAAKRRTPEHAGGNALKYTIGADASHPEDSDGVKTIQESDGEGAVKDGARRTEFRHAANRNRMSLPGKSPLAAQLMSPLR